MMDDGRWKMEDGRWWREEVRSKKEEVRSKREEGEGRKRFGCDGSGFWGNMQINLQKSRPGAIFCFKILAYVKSFL